MAELAAGEAAEAAGVPGGGGGGGFGDLTKTGGNLLGTLMTNIQQGVTAHNMMKNNLDQINLNFKNSNTMLTRLEDELAQEGIPKSLLLLGSNTPMTKMYMGGLNSRIVPRTSDFQWINSSAQRMMLPISN